ncbi:MAG: hypothetical protein IKJ34_06545, partial [Mailhella sp.]|nr:hypothetical protein [Mailhella sp.]
EPGAEAFRAAMTARSAKIDDWSALGFDFVQTAAALCLQVGWSPSLLNEWLAAAPAVDWAAAPMAWSENGIASRRLFLLRPASMGSQPADLAAMKERILSREADAQLVLEAQTEEENKKNPASIDQLVDSITKN